MILLIGVVIIIILALLLLLVRPRPVENAMVVVSHYKEDLSWLSRIRYKYVVYKKDQDDDYPYNVPVNKGNEASAYLKYIIDHYDNLPEYVIFVHGHESDWHHEDSMVDKLNSLRITKDYTNLNDSRHNFKLTYDKKQGFLLNGSTREIGPMNEWWDENMTQYFGDPWQYAPVINRDTCCAQFVIKRDNILRHSINFYKTQYKWLITTDLHNYYSGRYYEWLWKFIFSHDSGNFIPSKPSQRNYEDL
jgi:hypothetical protein